MTVTPNDQGLRKREHDLIDRQELDHYHRVIERMEGMHGAEAKEAAQAKSRRELQQMIMGDRTRLEQLRDINFWKEIADHFDGQRKAVNEMTHDQLLEKRRERVANGRTGNSNGYSR